MPGLSPRTTQGEHTNPVLLLIAATVIIVREKPPSGWRLSSSSMPNCGI